MELTIYEKLKARRKELGLSQDDLARLMGYKSRSTINKIESGQVDLSRSKIDKFSKVLQVSPSYLMGWTDQEENELDYTEWFTSILGLPDVDELADARSTIVDQYLTKQSSSRNLRKPSKSQISQLAKQLRETVTAYASAPPSAPPSEQPQLSPLHVVKRELSNPFKVADNGFAPRIKQGDLVHISVEKDLLPDKSVVAIQAVSRVGAIPIQDSVILRYFRYQIDYNSGEAVGIIFYTPSGEYPEIRYSLTWLKENPWALIGAVEKVEFTLP